MSLVLGALRRQWRGHRLSAVWRLIAKLQLRLRRRRLGRRRRARRRRRRRRRCSPINLISRILVSPHSPAAAAPATASGPTPAAPGIPRMAHNHHVLLHRPWRVIHRLLTLFVLVDHLPSDLVVDHFAPGVVVRRHEGARSQNGQYCENTI